MRLIYQKEEGSDETIELSDKPVVIGRSPDADLVINDVKVSRFHCGIRRIDDHYVLKDLGSRNGTFLNDRRTEKSERLKRGDHFRIGGTFFKIPEE